MESIGSRVLRERKAQGLKRTELAKKAGVGYSTISELERGGMKTSTKLRVIADALNVSLVWLETGKGPKKPPYPDPSQPSGLDWEKLYAALDFLEELFRAKGKVFDRRRYPELLAAVYQDLVSPEAPSVVQLSVKYGGNADAERDWRPDEVASAG